MRLGCVGLTLMVGACFGGVDEPHVPDRFVPPRVKAVAEGVSEGEEKFRAVAKRRGQGRTKTAAPTVLWITLGGVRADHTSLCGYARDTTPALVAMAKTPGASAHCGVVTPTLDAADRDVDPVDWIAIAQEGGAVTAWVSAEPVVQAARAGFGIVRAPPEGRWRKAKVVRQVMQVVADVPKTTPLVLRVTLSDARSPYPAVTASRGWGPAQPAVDVAAMLDDPDSVLARLGAGTLSDDQGERVRQRWVNAYDEGIRREDDALGEIMTVLARRDRDRDLRWAVVGDGGPGFGGAEGFGDARPAPGPATVPWVWYDSALEALPDVPKAFSGADVGPTLWDGGPPRQPSAPCVRGSGGARWCAR